MPKNKCYRDYHGYINYIVNYYNYLKDIRIIQVKFKFEIISGIHQRTIKT